jgi:hypothetical protein
MVRLPNPPTIKLRLTRRRRIRLAEIRLVVAAFREAVYSDSWHRCVARTGRAATPSECPLACPRRLLAHAHRRRLPGNSDRRERDMQPRWGLAGTRREQPTDLRRAPPHKGPAGGALGARPLAGLRSCQRKYMAALTRPASHEGPGGGRGARNTPARLPLPPTPAAGCNGDGRAVWLGNDCCRALASTCTDPKARARPSASLDVSKQPQSNENER